MSGVETRARILESGGPELAERIEYLDARNAAARRPTDTLSKGGPSGSSADYDVVVAGGGLSILIAPVLAARGLRVGVFERFVAATSHREWNASRPELELLVSSGLLSKTELAELLVARYDSGVCRFFGGKPHVVRGVLDHAVDATELLRRVRTVASGRGVAFHDRHTLNGIELGRQTLALRFAGPSGEDVRVTARVLVDARGSCSPYASFDLTCPTVGGTMGGLAHGSAVDEVNPSVGEILATVGPAQAGRQHVWEMFPGRDKRATVYLFYYARAGAAGTLLDLYAKFFEQRPRYKRGDAHLSSPTFGYIPAWSRLTRPPRPPSDRVVLMGDAALRHSPLTLCGFGNTLRSFVPTAERVTAIVEGRRSRRSSRPPADAPIHSLTGALAALMASETMVGDRMNALLDAAFGTLEELGNGPYAQLLQDDMSQRDFVRFVRKTATRRPEVYGDVVRGLGWASTFKWGGRLARELFA